MLGLGRIFIYVNEISLNNDFRFFKKREWYKEKDDFCVSDDPGARVTSKQHI